MDKNYYEILEIDKKASPEMIKKAYSTLAKKYHPDLQPNNLKANCEEKLKLINKAYEVLSDAEKRKEYDTSLKILENKNKEFVNNLINENNILKSKLNNIDNLYKNTQNNSNIRNNNTCNNSKTLKEHLVSLISIFITISILFFIWQLPFVRKFFSEIEGLNIIANFLNNLF